MPNNLAGDRAKRFGFARRNLKARRLLSELAHPSDVSADPPLTSPAPEILTCLLQQPQAEYTMERIQWAAFPSCIGKLATKIAETVEELVELGYLDKKQSSDGKSLYQVSSQYLSTIHQRSAQNPDADVSQKAI